MKINWEKYVDKIYCIQYIFNKERTEDLNNELYRVDIVQSKLYEVIEQFPSPLYNILFNHFNNYSNMVDPIKYFNSFIGHYAAIKKAYLENLNYILVLEDDCRFLKDKQQIINILDNSIDKFKKIEGPAIYGGSISYEANGEDCIKEYDSLYNIFNAGEVYLAGTAFNIYNRKAMKILIDFVENLNYAIIDQYHVIYANTDTKFFIINKHICIQQDWLYLMYNTCRDYNMFKPSYEELENKKSWGETFNRDTNKIYNDIKKYFNM